MANNGDTELTFHTLDDGDDAELISILSAIAQAKFYPGSTISYLSWLLAVDSMMEVVKSGLIYDTIRPAIEPRLIRVCQMLTRKVKKLSHPVNMSDGDIYCLSSAVLGFRRRSYK